MEWHMRTSTRSIVLPALLLATCLSSSAFAAQTPSSIQIKVYKFAVSTSEVCENPVIVYSNDHPAYAEFTSNPTLGTAHIEDGTYPCVMLQMSDLVRFAPSEDDGECRAGQPETIDVCALHGGGGEDGGTDGGPASGDPSGEGGSGGSMTQDLGFQNLDGTVSACSPVDGHEDLVVLYLSTAAASDGTTSGPHNSFRPPKYVEDPTDGLRLGAPLVIAGLTAATFVVDGRGKVSAGYGQCAMQPPLFSFE
jgi:hypothetical protein